MDIDSFIVYIYSEYIYSEISEDIETRFDTSNYELDRQLLKGKSEKVISSMKDEILKEFTALRAKPYTCLKDNSNEDKKLKAQKSMSSKGKPNLKITNIV